MYIAQFFTPLKPPQPPLSSSTTSSRGVPFHEREKTIKGVPRTKWGLTGRDGVKWLRSFTHAQGLPSGYRGTDLNVGLVAFFCDALRFGGSVLSPHSRGLHYGTVRYELDLYTILRIDGKKNGNDETDQPSLLCLRPVECLCGLHLEIAASYVKRPGRSAGWLARCRVADIEYDVMLPTMNLQIMLTYHA